MAVGRKTVAARQTIESQWGNQVWDQSVQTFANKAQRDTQFPAPHLGACCALDDHPGILMEWGGSAWWGWQAAGIVLGTTGDAVAVLTFPKPFSANPTVYFTGDSNSGTPGWSVIACPLTGTVLGHQVTVMFRAISATAGIYLLTSTAVGIYWSAFGQF